MSGSRLNDCWKPFLGALLPSTLKWIGGLPTLRLYLTENNQIDYASSLRHLQRERSWNLNEPTLFFPFRGSPGYSPNFWEKNNFSGCLDTTSFSLQTTCYHLPRKLNSSYALSATTNHKHSPLHRTWYFMEHFGVYRLIFDSQNNHIK